MATALDEATETGSATGHAVRLTIPARPEYISLCRLALTGLARVRPLSADLLADLKLALTEACSNSVRHAYPGGAGVVEIALELRPDRIVVEVTDNGAGFVPVEPRSRDELSEGGLGIAIINAIADELHIRGGDAGRGSHLRFVKLLPA